MPATQSPIAPYVKAQQPACPQDLLWTPKRTPKPFYKRLQDLHVPTHLLLCMSHHYCSIICKKLFITADSTAVKAGVREEAGRERRLRTPALVLGLLSRPWSEPHVVGSFRFLVDILDTAVTDMLHHNIVQAATTSSALTGASSCVLPSYQGFWSTHRTLPLHIYESIAWQWEFKWQYQ